MNIIKNIIFILTMCAFANAKVIIPEIVMDSTYPSKGYVLIFSDSEGFKPYSESDVIGSSEDGCVTIPKYSDRRSRNGCVL